MTTDNLDSPDATSAQSSLDGYWYQLKVSVFIALDVLASKQQADQITLEPVSEEDLETEIDEEPGALTQGLSIKARKLVIQCKQRNTGPWTIGGLARLLSHGKRRTPPKERLKNPDISYLLVTSADASGAARKLLVNSPTQWQKLGVMPATLKKVLPDNASGRVAVWNSLDQERVEHRTVTLLTERFRVPQSQLDKCVEQLEQGALLRMRGSQAGVWKRQDIIAIIEECGGYDGTTKDLAKFVPPANWDDLLAQLEARNAIVLTGPSGTGKTTTAKALIASMREKNPFLTHVKVEGGPERLRDDKTSGPIIFEIEDPWGRYRVEPDSLPWNDEINGFLASASPDRMFVITSRSDVMQDANPRSLDQRYKANLLAGHYRSSDRKKLFENRLATLRRADQVAAYKYLETVIKELELPLELDRFFAAAGLGAHVGENEATFIRRCIEEARNQSIESALTLVIERQEKWEVAAILWALLKARKRLTYGVLEELEYDLSSVVPNVGDQLSAFAGTLVAGGNLRQDKSEIACSHPRIEAGLEQAMLTKKVAASRTLSGLLDALVAMDAVNKTDWGTESAVLVAAAVSSVTDVRVNISPSTQTHLDDWLTKRLASLDDTFRDDLALASKVGSQVCDVAEVARWLDESPIDEQWFNMTSWKEPKKSKKWYRRLSKAPHTHAICDAFITRVVAHRSGQFRGNFHGAIEKLSPDLTPSFLSALSEVVAHGYNPNTETLIKGAIVDLDGFEMVFDEAAARCENDRQSRDRKSLLALHNRDYDDEAIEHYWESLGEDGYSASEILRAYIDARRQCGDWEMFIEHPILSGFLWEWIHVAYKDDEPPSIQELLALGRASRGSRYEKDYWELVDRHFDKALIPTLEDRLRTGSEFDATRMGATTAALNQAPQLLEELISKNSGVSTYRLLELVLDIRSCLENGKSEGEERARATSKFVEAADEEVQTAVAALLDEDGPKASDEAIAILSTVPLEAPMKLSLAVAQCLARSGQDGVSRLQHILSSAVDVNEHSIELVAAAMRIAAGCRDAALTKLGMEHEFARVRVEAMNALFDQTSGPLPETLLNMRHDPSSMVRRRLVEMLEARPDSSHISTLVKLAFDTWTPDHHRQETHVSFPIANCAIETLRAEHSLSDGVYKELIKCLKQSNNFDVRLHLLRTMVRHGAPHRKKKLVELAVGEGRPTYQRLTALLRKAREAWSTPFPRRTYPTASVMGMPIAV